jgi:hypothetical protein
MSKYTVDQMIARRKQIWEQHKDIEKDRVFRETVTKEVLTNKDTLFKDIQDNPEKLIELVFVIVDKEKNIVPFFLNEVQKDFISRINKAKQEYEQGKRLYMRFLVLKGRQAGFTSFITAYQLASTITHRNFSGFTIADCQDNTSSIFEDKAKQPFSLLPKPLKPAQKYNNKKEMFFDKINSSWRIATASKEIGRSKTINFLHGSESAFWQVPISDIQAAVGEALTRNAIQIYESTPNGYNEFKDLWDSGKWENCYYEWWRSIEYRLDFENEYKKEQFLLDIDRRKEWIWCRLKWLRDDKNLDIKQLYWYYNKWDSYINKEKIKQEYSSTPDEAFLASGNCVFDKEIIIKHKEYLKSNTKPIKTGFFEFKWNDPSCKDRILEDSISFTDNPYGYIRIYEEPDPLAHYVIGGDTKGDGSDWFTATVINNCTGKRVCTLHSQSDDDTYTHQVYCLGMYYNQALIGIEVNFNVYPVRELTRLNYPKQYMRTRFDKRADQFEDKYGFKTDTNTRPMIISKEITLIRDNIDLFTDISFLDECLSFVYDKDMRPDAESGKHDDILFSDMIAEAIRPQQRFDYTRQEQQKTIIQEHKDKIMKRNNLARRLY